MSTMCEVVSRGILADFLFFKKYFIPFWALNCIVLFNLLTAATQKKEREKGTDALK